MTDIDKIAREGVEIAGKATAECDRQWIAALRAAGIPIEGDER